MDKKQLMVNMAANLLSFFVSICISFFLTPYITEAMGSEAYGFISLGNNFVNAMTVVSIAINTMSSRFIAVSWYEKKIERARQYYSSVLAANLVLTAILALPSILLAAFLERFVRISGGLIPDVKALFLFMFAAFFVDILTTVFSVAPFVKNRLDLAAGRDIARRMIRALILLLMFSLFRPHVWYYGMAVLLAGAACALMNIALKNRLMPELAYRRKDVSMNCVKNLLRSGIWSSVSYLSSILIEGLDLLVANLFIDAPSMGVLSIAKTVPAAVNSMISSVQTVFVPEFTKSYAEKNDDLLEKVYAAVKLMSVFSIAPISVMVTLGNSFFSLWVPSQNERVLYILSILTLGGLFITAAMYPLFSIFIITDNVRFYSLCRITQGALGLVVEIVILKCLSPQLLNNPDLPLGLYTIAGVSSAFGIVFALTVVPLYAARCLHENYMTFYPTIARSILVTALVCAAGKYAFGFMRIDAWFSLFLTACVCALCSVLLAALLILNRKDRISVAKKLKEIAARFRPKS